MEKSLCINCGKYVVYPSVDPVTREAICNKCRKPGLIDVPKGQLRPIAKEAAA